MLNFNRVKSFANFEGQISADWVYKKYVKNFGYFQQFWEQIILDHYQSN